MERDGRHRLGRLVRLLAVASAAGALGVALVMLPLRLLRLRRNIERETGEPAVTSMFGPQPDPREQGAAASTRAGSSPEVRAQGAEHQEGSGAHLPLPTYWPAVLGFGLTLIMFGLVTNHAFTLVGVLLMIASVIGWIGDLLHG